MPQDNFKNNLSILNNFVLNLSPDYSTCQLDVFNDFSYILSFNGTAILNPNKELLKFIISIKINFNFKDGILDFTDQQRVENVISIDFIKLKIFQ